MKIANINNLSLVAIAMERLINRPDGLPGLGVLYGRQDNGHGGGGQQHAGVLRATEERVEQENPTGKNLL